MGSPFSQMQPVIYQPVISGWNFTKPMPYNVVDGTFVKVDDNTFVVVPRPQCKCICIFTKNKRNYSWNDIRVTFPASYPKGRGDLSCCVDKKKKIY